jgi:hypothetical protein
MVIFGGLDPQNSARTDAWVLVPEIRYWARQLPAGTAPSARYGHSAIYDAGRDRMVIFGGVADGNPLNDVKTLVWGSPSSVTVESPGDLAWPAGTGRTVSLVYRVSNPYDFSQAADYDRHTRVARLHRGGQRDAPGGRCCLDRARGSDSR